MHGSLSLLVDDGFRRNVLFFLCGSIGVFILALRLSQFGLASAPHSCLFGSSVCTLLSLGGG